MYELLDETSLYVYCYSQHSSRYDNLFASQTVPFVAEVIGLILNKICTILHCVHEFIAL